MRRFFSLLLVLVCFSLAYAKTTPMDFVKDRVNSIIEVLKSTKLSSKEKMDRVGRIIDSSIYWERVAKMVLGIHYRSIKREQFDQFSRLFRRFVVKVYSKKFVKYSVGEDLSKIRVIYKRQIKEDDTYTVLMDLITAKGSVVPISCKVAEVNGRWLIYDIYVEGISMVNNYRSQINRVILKRGFNHLMKVLRRKVKG